MLESLKQWLFENNRERIFSVNRDDLNKKPEIKELLKISDLGGYEKIKPASEFLAVDTPLGRICVCICLDFIDPDNFEAFRSAGINVFFVPAMSLSNIQFRNTATAFGRNNLASSFVALGYFMPVKHAGIHEENASFRYVPSGKNTYQYAVSEKSEILVFTITRKG